MNAEFDLDRSLRASKKVDLQGVEWDRVGESPVTTTEARCLAYMRDIESHTVVFLRDLLATRAMSDPDVTAVVACWVDEERWHREAFRRKDERRHFAFYRAQTRMRLARSGRARRVTRWAVTRLWAPVGTGGRAQSETGFVVTALVGGGDARAAVADMDATVAALPGLEGLTVYADAVASAARRHGPPGDDGFVADPDRGLAVTA